MSAIQNSMNKMLGTAAAGIAIASKMAPKEEDENGEALKEADALLKKSEAEEDLNKLNEQYAKDKDELGHWQEGKVDVGNGNYMETNEDLSKDIKMRKKALKVMKEKMKARKLQLEAYKTMLGGKK